MWVRYDVEDGYGGPSRQHFVNIPDDWLLWEADKESAFKIVTGIVQEDFDQKVYPYISNEDEVKSHIEAIFESEKED